MEPQTEIDRNNHLVKILIDLFNVKKNKNSDINEKIQQLVEYSNEVNLPILHYGCGNGSSSYILTEFLKADIVSIDPKTKKFEKYPYNNQPKFLHDVSQINESDISAIIGTVKETSDEEYIKFLEKNAKGKQVLSIQFKDEEKYHVAYTKSFKTPYNLIENMIVNITPDQF